MELYCYSFSITAQYEFVININVRSRNMVNMSWCDFILHCLPAKEKLCSIKFILNLTFKKQDMTYIPYVYCLLVNTLDSSCCEAWMSGEKTHWRLQSMRRDISTFDRGFLSNIEGGCPKIASMTLKLKVTFSSLERHELYGLQNQFFCPAYNIVCKGMISTGDGGDMSPLLTSLF